MEPEPEAGETAEPEPGPEAGETELVESDSEDSGDPGVVIIYSDANTVDTALGQGSVANIVLPAEIGPNVPVLQQGKLKAYLLVY